METSKIGGTEKNEDTLGGRLKLLEPRGLTAEQRETYDYLRESKISWANRTHFRGDVQDGRLIGPFNVYLYSPQMGRAFNGWVDAEADNTSLSPTVRQIIILTVGALWNSAYELYAHTAVAHTVGISDRTIAEIKAGQQPLQISDEETIAWEFARTLVTKHAVDDALYRRAVETFDEKGVVDMIHLIGLYLSTSALLNAFTVPVP